MTKDMAQKIRIAIVEDVKDVAENLKELINDEPDFQCQQVYHNAEEAIVFLEKAPVDIVLLDIGLPKASGIDLMIALKDKIPHTQYCMFTVFADDDKIFNSISAGAKGYILKNDDPGSIMNSLRELYHGGSPMSPTIARKVIDAFSNQGSKSTTQELPLSKRELQLLDLLSQGLLYKEISAQLGITVGTVKQHIHNIYEKLQVNNKTEAINLYLKR
jgi:DNA-binding NarL/FixJ family response regulator